MTTEDEKFTAFVKSLPAKHWSKYDLSAVRLGWDAAIINGFIPGDGRSDETKFALSLLFHLKTYKDKHGKDNYYLEQQPIAWNLAKIALGLNE